MKVIDSIYGEERIEEAVLNDLIDSNAVQRLKGIYQAGATVYMNEAMNVTRYEHSIGVMLCIRRIGGSLEEQIAGLLHDVSHTAFSHVIDYVLERNQEDYHDQIKAQVMEKSDIPYILQKHGYEFEKFINHEEKWTLLDQPAPDLCADRIDYTLRDLYEYGQITKSEVDAFLQSLCVHKGMICVKSREAAEWFVDAYYKEVIDFFMNPLYVFGYDRLARALNEALQSNVLQLSDLQQTDEEVMAHMQKSGRPEIMHWLEQLHSNVQVIEDGSDYDLHRKNKVRLIDPLVVEDGDVRRISDHSEAVKKKNAEAYRKASQGTYVKVMKV